MAYCVGKGASRAQGDERRKKRMKNSEIKGVKAITRLKPYYKDNKKDKKVIKICPRATQMTLESLNHHNLHPISQSNPKEEVSKRCAFVECSRSF